MKRRVDPVNRDPNRPYTVNYHHIIPVCCNGNNTSRRDTSNVFGSNLVGLTVREHFVAHKLLLKIYEKSEYIRKISTAYAYMALKFRRNKLIRVSSRDYVKAIMFNGINARAYTKGKIWVNNGEIERRVYPDQIPDGFVKGHMIHGMINVTNGILTIRAYPDQIPEGYYPGYHTKGKKIWVTDGTRQKLALCDNIPEGFKSGKL